MLAFAGSSRTDFLTWEPMGHPLNQAFLTYWYPVITPKLVHHSHQLCIPVLTKSPPFGLNHSARASWHAHSTNLISIAHLHAAQNIARACDRTAALRPC